MILFVLDKKIPISLKPHLLVDREVGEAGTFTMSIIKGKMGF